MSDTEKELSRVADALTDIAQSLDWFRALFTEQQFEDEIRDELAPQEAPEVVA